MKSSPLVTVITPLYNHGQYITACIESVLAQTYTPIEMIVVDDGSTDEGPAIVEKYARHGVKLIRNPRNGYGVARALNTAILNDQGEYISWLSSDDLYVPEKIQKNLAFFLEAKKHNPRIGALHSDAYAEIRDLKLKKIYGPAQEELEAQLATQGYARWALDMKGLNREEMLYRSFFWNPVNGCTTFIPKQTYLDVGLFKDTWTLSQDFDMWFRILLYGYEFAFLPEPLSITRFHEGNSEYYRSEVPAEGMLMMRYYSQMVGWQDFEVILRHKGFTELARDFYLEMAQLFLDKQAYDHTLLYLEQFQALGGTLSTETLEQVAQIQSHFQHIQPQPADTSGFLIAVGQEGKTERLYAVLNHFLLAFSHQKQVSLHIWLQDHPDQTQDYIAEKLEQAGRFLNIPASAWPPIYYHREQSLEAVIGFARTFIPTASPGLLEQQLIYFYQQPGYLVQYAADASYLRSTAAYWAVSPWLTSEPPGLYSLLYLGRKPIQIVEAHPDKIWLSGPKTWFEWAEQWLDDPPNPGFKRVYALDDWRPLLERSPQPDVFLYLNQETASQMLQAQGWATTCHSATLRLSLAEIQAAQLTDIFESPQTLRFLSIYSEDNITGWQEAVLAFLQTYQQTDAIELVLYVPASEATDTLEAQIQEVLKKQGLSEAQAPAMIVLIEEDLGRLSDILMIFAQVQALVLPFKSPLVFQRLFNLVLALDGWNSLLIPAHQQDLKSHPDLLLPPSFETLEKTEQVEVLSQIYQALQKTPPVPFEQAEFIAFLAREKRLLSLEKMLERIKV